MRLCAPNIAVAPANDFSSGLEKSNTARTLAQNLMAIELSICHQANLSTPPLHLDTVGFAAHR